MAGNAASCSSCSAPMLWALTARGRRIPLDAAPVADGTFVLVKRIDGEPLALAAKLVPPLAGIARYVSHFATCPNASQHRSAR